MTPEAPVATEWTDIDPELLSNQPSDHPEWWAVFNDPVLNQLIETAKRRT